MKNNILLTTIAVLLFGAIAAHAEFDDLGTSARASGMGNCYIAIADDAFATFYNPAGLGLIHHKEIATTSSRLLMGLSDLSTINENIVGAVYGTQLYGSLGVGLHTFEVSSLYKESASKVSYGKMVRKDIYAGATIKFLSKAYTPNAYTENAIDFSGETFGRDPVFSNGYSKSFMSYDIGSFYQMNKRISFALVLKDITSPDTGLSSVSKLPLTTTAGACYREDGVVVPFEIQARENSLVYSAGFERWLFSDSLALRAGLQEGSGSLSEVSCGMSYSYNSIIRFDYGFSMPLGAITNTSGSHRLSLVVSIGKPRVDVFDLAKQPRDYQDAVIAFDKGQYYTAYDLFQTMVKSLETSRQVKERSTTYIKEILARMETKVKDNVSPTEVAYAKGLQAYSQPDYNAALTQLEAFAAIIPGNTEVNYYIELLKKMLGKQGTADTGKKDQPQDEFPGLEGQENEPLMASMGKEDYVAFKLRAAVVDFSQGRYDTSVKDCLYALRADPKSEMAHVRLGSAYYAMGLGKYATKAWQKALLLNPNNKDLKEFMQKKGVPLTPEQK
jgi:hypothetical protein